MIFRDSDHAQRWAAAIQTAEAIRDDDTVNGDFGASLFILTGLPSVYDRADRHIHNGYIDFEPMFCMGLSTSESILVALAGNLYNGGFFDRFTPQDIVSYCDTDGVSLAAQALILRQRRIDINTIFEEEPDFGLR